MPQGRRATNLDLSSDVIELIGIKDLGAGARKVVRISLIDFLAWVEAAFASVSARATADAQRSIGLASQALSKGRQAAAQAARAAADATRALGAANNALTRIRQLGASVARVDANAHRALGLANNVSNRVSHLDDVQIVLRTQVFS